jgi:hypothetical protein
LNIYVNPYSSFSDYQLETKKVHSDRVSKYERLLAIEEIPEAFIFGSSNSMRFRPDYLKEKSGLNSFNYGVFHARVEDFWCISNVLINELHFEPKLVVFCLDDWNFADEPAPNDEFFKGAEKRLAYKFVYSKYLDDYSDVKLKWFQFKSSINIDQTLASISALKEQVDSSRSWEKTVPDISETFYEDGVRKKYGKLTGGADISELAESGEFDVTQDLKDTHKDWKRFANTKDGILTGSHEMFENFSMRRLRLFVRTIELLNDSDCEVVLNLMPLQPYYQNLVVESTNYLERMRSLNSFLLFVQSKFENVILLVDNSDIQFFNGFENHFFDTIHPTSVNSDLMLDRIFNLLEEDAL